MESPTTPQNQNKNSFGGVTAQDFDAISIRVASPDAIRSWSYGEVTKAETINYRTGRSERNGLFDERIFGPEKDFECYCGKYRRIRYKGIICEKCGVEVTKSIVRRERMGHIELASPVTHIWFLRGIPSRLATLLDIPVSELERVVYFASYIIVSVNDREKAAILKRLDAEYKSKVKQASDTKERDSIKDLFRQAKEDVLRMEVGVVLGEADYHRFSLRYGTAFEASIGAEAMYDMCVKMNLEELATELTEKLESARGAAKIKIKKRLGLVHSLIEANIRPEWMFLTVIPIIPPALRPMVALQGGRHATSDINDLYRRVINRNIRLKKLQEIEAPDVILRNEKRILQEAVDALIDNAKRHQSQVAISPSQRRALKSLADNLSGKQGYFRQNLLGKRVDYSGRSVIVVGADLRLDQCGLPKHMALELFRPFVIAGLLKKELAYNIRGAGRLIEEEIPEVWEILEEVTKDKYVLLNRAPTLHRLGVQAFRPVLIEGNAIQIHPLVCTAFNADFDGDMMAVHVPLSEKAQEEARTRMASNVNLLSPGSGAPIVNPSQDIVLGCFWMTKQIEGEKGEGKIFATPNEAITAYDFGQVGFRAKVKVLATDSKKYAEFNGEVFETTVGRLLFNSVLPSDFPYINKEVRKKDLSAIIESLIDVYGMERTPAALDKIKAFGFRYATVSGITWGMGDISVPKEKKELIEKGQKIDDEINEQWKEGLLSNEERYRKIIAVWQGIHSEVEALVPGTLDSRGSVYDMVTSGARGSIGQVTQMAGMKGLIPSPTGRLIDFPIVPSYKEGLSPIEYFVTTHGARKGLADTALKTAESGYLTRRLVYVADNAVILESNCGVREGRRATPKNISGFEISLAEEVYGHVLTADILNKSGKVAVERGTLVGRKEAEEIERSGAEEAMVRTPLTCKTIRGLCQKCYGADMGTGNLVEIGEPVGIVAAQSIGEPGTQLTMRTFHQEGVAGADITTGLPRVAEVFERRAPKSKAVVSTVDGTVMDIRKKDGEKEIVILADKEAGAKPKKKSEEVVFTVPFARSLVVENGAQVKKGDMLTDGSADLAELYKYAGQVATEEYIIREILKVYELQGVKIVRKHIEIIVREMFSRRRIKDSGDTRFVMGEIVEEGEYLEENARVKEKGKMEAKGERVILGITEVSLTTSSFLSAASFQRVSRVLIDAAVKGKRDDLSGLKENVIVGRLIPAGTGFNVDEKEEKEDSEEEE